MTDKLRVLHIDNDPLSRSVVRAMLSLRAVELTEVGSALWGERMIRGGDYDLVLMDLRMHDTDGMDLLHRLQEDGGAGETRIAILTGDARELVAAACLSAGAAKVLHKPVRMSDLFALLPPASAPMVAAA